MKKEFKTRNRRLLARDILVDEGYQRRLDMSHANKLARDFVLDRIGTIHVSERSDGKWYCIDGQHRLKALDLLGSLDQSVDVRIYYGMTRKDEADMFYYLNSFKRPGAIDRYFAAIIAGHSREREVDKTIRKHGFHVDYQCKPHTLTCASRLVQIHKKGGEALLSKTLDTCKKVWGNGELFDQYTLGGFALFLYKFGDEIDLDRLVKKVSKEFNPRTLHASARAMKAALGGSFDVNTADSIVNIYNKGANKDRLPHLRK